MPIVLKSGSINLLEPSRPVQTCNGIALYFKFYSILYIPRTQSYLRSVFCSRNKCNIWRPSQEEDDVLPVVVSCPVADLLLLLLLLLLEKNRQSHSHLHLWDHVTCPAVPQMRLEHLNAACRIIVPSCSMSRSYDGLARRLTVYHSTRGHITLDFNLQLRSSENLKSRCVQFLVKYRSFFYNIQGYSSVEPPLPPPKLILPLCVTHCCISVVFNPLKTKSICVI